MPYTPQKVSLQLNLARSMRSSSVRVLNEVAFGYARYSDPSQDPMSIDRQVDSIHETQRRYDLPLPQLFIDEGLTGQDNKRQGMMNLLAALNDNFGAYLLVESIDRVFRSLPSYAEFQECIAVNQIRVFNRNGPIVPEMMPIEAMVAVTEIKRFRARGDYKKKMLRLEGRYCGRAPYGFKKVGKELVADVTMENVKLMFDLAEQLVPPARIAKILHQRGIPTPLGARFWQSSVITYMLTNPIYAGVTAYWAEPDRA